MSDPTSTTRGLRIEAAPLCGSNLGTPPPLHDLLVEGLGEALYRLSDRLRESGWLAKDDNFLAYQDVVEGWLSLTATAFTQAMEARQRRDAKRPDPKGAGPVPEGDAP